MPKAVFDRLLPLHEIIGVDLGRWHDARLQAAVDRLFATLDTSDYDRRLIRTAEVYALCLLLTSASDERNDAGLRWCESSCFVP